MGFSAWDQGWSASDGVGIDRSQVPVAVVISQPSNTTKGLILATIVVSLGGCAATHPGLSYRVANENGVVMLLPPRLPVKPALERKFVFRTASPAGACAGEESSLELGSRK